MKRKLISIKPLRAGFVEVVWMDEQAMIFTEIYPSTLIALDRIKNLKLASDIIKIK